MSSFKRATREQLRLRMAIDGPSGSGKSMTALRFGFALAAHEAKKADRPGELRVACIDSERGRLKLYQGMSPDGIPFDFSYCDLASFSPTEYTAKIEEAGRGGFDVLITDSLSHAWAGKDGALEIVDRQNTGNSFTAWKNVTPMHNAMIEAILQSPCHQIVTMRSKTEYVLEPNDKGKMIPRKIGLAPIQRAGMEYEFDLYCSMDWSHILTVTKSRCPAVDGKIEVKPGASFMDGVIEWLEKGTAVPLAPTNIMADDQQLTTIARTIQLMGRGLDQEKKELLKRYSVYEFRELTREQASEFIKRLEIALREKQEKDKRFTESVFQQPIDAPAPNAAVREEPKAPELPAAPPPKNETGNSISTQLLTHLAELRTELFTLNGITGQADVCTQKWQEILARRKVTSARQLTEAQGLELAEGIRAVIRKLKGDKGGNGAEQPFRGNGDSGTNGNGPAETAGAAVAVPANPPS